MTPPLVGRPRRRGGQVLINTVSITAPSAGFLIISGHAFILNYSAEGSYVIRPQVDGANVTGAGWGAYFAAAAPGERSELSYTHTTAVTGGLHTVTQFLGPLTDTSTFFHNNEDLTVLFVPTGSLASAQSSGEG